MIGRHRGLSWLIGPALGALFLWLAVRDADLAQIGAAFRGSRPALAPALLALLVAFYALKAIRWRMILWPVARVRSRELVPAMMIGFAGNNLLPARLGELLRTYVLARQLRLRSAAVLATLVVERAFDFLAVAASLGVVLLVGPEVPPPVARAGLFVTAVSIALLLLCAILALRPRWAHRLARIAGRVVPRRTGAWLIRQVELAASGFSAIRSGGLLAGIAVTSAAQWALMAAALYTGVLAVRVDAPPSSGFVVLALSVAALTLPTAPGFFGTIELCYVLALAPFGVPPAEAFAAAVFYHVLAYVSVTAAGLYFVYRSGMTLRGLRRAASDPTTETD